VQQDIPLQTRRYTTHYYTQAFLLATSSYLHRFSCTLKSSWTRSKKFSPKIKRGFRDG